MVKSNTQGIHGWGGVPTKICEKVQNGLKTLVKIMKKMGQNIFPKNLLYAISQPKVIIFCSNVVQWTSVVPISPKLMSCRKFRGCVGVTGDGGLSVINAGVTKVSSSAHCSLYHNNEECTSINVISNKQWCHNLPLWWPKYNTHSKKCHTYLK